MVSTKLLLVIAFVMIGAAVSTSLTCAAVTANAASKATCNAEKDSTHRCCYNSYKSGNVEAKACLPITNAQFDAIGDFIKGAKNSAWENYSLDCAQSYITLSFMILALFALLF